MNDEDLLRGGQGRTEEDVASSAMALATCLLWGVLIAGGSWVCVTMLCGCGRFHSTF